jgi:hypothetical protein
MAYDHRELRIEERDDYIIRYFGFEGTMIRKLRAPADLHSENR